MAARLGSLAKRGGVVKSGSVSGSMEDSSVVDAAALARRQALTGASGPMALVKNIKVFGIACFACLGG